ncbi:VOC family protein [Chloroflexota bacterium]
MFKRIDHVEIVPSDPERTIDFYTNILGFKIKERRTIAAPEIDELVFLQLNDTMVELLAVKNPASISSEHWQVSYRRFCLEVEDMDRTVDYLKSKGIAITVGPITSGKSKRAEIEDPDGLSIELKQL